MEEWLGGLHLSQFYEKIVEDGCADMAFLLICNDDDIATMCDIVGMRHMQKATFLRSLAKLKEDWCEVGFEGGRVLSGFEVAVRTGPVLELPLFCGWVW